MSTIENLYFRHRYTSVSMAEGSVCNFPCFDIYVPKSSIYPSQLLLVPVTWLIAARYGIVRVLDDVFIASGAGCLESQV